MYLSPHSRFAKDTWRWMAEMTEKGFPLSDILESLAGMNRWGAADSLRFAAARAKEGEKLSAALEQSGRAVLPPVMEMIKVGEAHDRLKEALAAAADVVSPPPPKWGRQWSVMGTAVYILIVSCVLLSFQTIQLTFITPFLKQVFIDLSPGSGHAAEIGAFATLGLINFFILLAVFLFAIFLLSPQLHFPAALKALDVLPLIGRSMRMGRLWRSLHLIGSLAKAGVPLPEAIAATGRAFGRSELTEAGARLAAKVSAGENVWSAIMADPASPEPLRFAAGLAGGEDAAAAILREAANLRRLEFFTTKRAGMAMEVALVILLLISGIIYVLPVYAPLLIWFPTL